MIIRVLPLIAALLALIVATQAAATKVTLHDKDDVEAEGVQGWDTTEDVTDLQPLGRNDYALSVSVREGGWAVFYPDAHFQGPSLCVRSDWSVQQGNLRAPWLRGISSIKVFPGVPPVECDEVHPPEAKAEKTPASSGAVSDGVTVRLDDGTTLCECGVIIKTRCEMPTCDGGGLKSACKCRACDGWIPFCLECAPRCEISY